MLSWDRTDVPEFTSCRLGSDEVRADEHDPLTGVRRRGQEWRLLDPCAADGITAPRQAMRRHSSFTADPVWTLALAELTAPYRRSGDGVVTRAVDR